MVCRACRIIEEVGGSRYDWNDGDGGDDDGGTEPSSSSLTTAATVSS